MKLIENLKCFYFDFTNNNKNITKLHTFIYKRKLYNVIAVKKNKVTKTLYCLFSFGVSSFHCSKV